MIIRLMHDAQYRVPEQLAAELNDLDQLAVEAIETDDEAELRRLLERITVIVRERGERLDDAHLGASDVIIPPADLTLAEARQLFTEEGLIPELPSRQRGNDGTAAS